MFRMFLLSLTIAAFTMTLSANAQRGGPASVFVENVEVREFSNQIEALGTLEPNEQVELSLNAADRVRAVYFDDGQRVVKGKTLLSLAQREQIALVEGAEATVEEARRQLNRITRLVESEAVSQSELDQARRNMDSAAAQLRAVQSRQQDRVLVAPFDGVLGFRQVSVGSFVRPGDVVATLIDDSEMNLEFAVPSIFLRSLQPGTQIQATTDDLPGEVFDGEIATLNNSIDPVTRSVRVRATLPNPDRLLISGMFMQVTLVADPRSAPAIPEEAIQPVGPKTFVFTATERDGKMIATRREVSLGARQNGYVEVLAGLEDGDKIITEGLIRVREGAEIVVRDKAMLLPSASDTRPSQSGNMSAPG